MATYDRKKKTYYGPLTPKQEKARYAKGARQQAEFEQRRAVARKNPPKVKTNRFIPCTAVRVTKKNGRTVLEIRRTVKKRKKR